VLVSIEALFANSARERDQVAPSPFEALLPRSGEGLRVRDMREM
jgi:hypothetical protein